MLAAVAGCLMMLSSSAGFAFASWIRRWGRDGPGFCGLHLGRLSFHHSSKPDHLVEPDGNRHHHIRVRMRGWPRATKPGGYLGTRRAGQRSAHCARMWHSGDKDWVGGLSWRSPQETTYLCGETPFLGVTANNIGAIRLRESSGFVVRRELTIIARASMWDRPSRWSASGSQTRSPAPRRS